MRDYVVLEEHKGPSRPTTSRTGQVIPAGQHWTVAGVVKAHSRESAITQVHGEDTTVKTYRALPASDFDPAVTVKQEKVFKRTLERKTGKLQTPGPVPSAPPVKETPEQGRPAPETPAPAAPETPVPAPRETPEDSLLTGVPA